MEEISVTHFVPPNCLTKRDNGYYGVLVLKTFLPQQRGRAPAGRWQKHGGRPPQHHPLLAPFSPTHPHQARALVPHTYESTFSTLPKERQHFISAHDKCTTDRCYKTRL